MAPEPVDYLEVLGRWRRLQDVRCLNYHLGRSSYESFRCLGRDSLDAIADALSWFLQRCPAIGTAGMPAEHWSLLGDLLNWLDARFVLHLLHDITVVPGDRGVGDYTSTTTLLALAFLSGLQVELRPEESHPESGPARPVTRPCPESA